MDGAIAEEWEPSLGSSPAFTDSDEEAYLKVAAGIGCGCRVWRGHSSADIGLVNTATIQDSKEARVLDDKPPTSYEARTTVVGSSHLGTFV
jgi:hypothetical protein